ncbi:MAG: PH domain-containing protein [Actinomycetota bacterium]|nr:PH domain-containing protein [Actinomycetota bacterium]
MTADTVAHPRPGGSVEGRLHPLSPFVNSWKWFAAVLAFQAQQAMRSVDLRVAAAVLVVTLVVAGGYGVLAWRFTRYGFDGEDFRVDSGVVFRRSRRVRLDRLQAVDVVRPLLARALGLAELRLEMAGGGTPEAPLAYLSEQQAHVLRTELLARAAGLQHEEAQAPEAPEAVVHRVPPLRLLLSGLLTTPVVVTVLAVPLVLLAAVVTGAFEVIFLVGPAVLSVGAAVVQGFVRNFEFTVATSPDGLRLRRGLTETRAQTVPPGRVQAVRMVEPWLWRLAGGWVRLEVNVAGYAHGDGEARMSSALLLPVAPRRAAMAVLSHVLPGVDVEGIPLRRPPRRTRWLDPVGWRALGVGADARVLVTRRGVVRRETDVIPHARAQSVRWTQGPLQRALRLATVHVDSTPGPVHVAALHRGADGAAHLLVDLVERARVARALDPPERWMTAGGASLPGPDDRAVS